MLGWWNLGRASGLGAVAGLLALVLWPFQRSYEGLLWPFAAAAGVAGLCGLSMLLITAADMLLHRRGRRLRPVRAFDLILGLGLVALSLLQLSEVRGQLPA
jgi:hypothetical protein